MNEICTYCKQRQAIQSHHIVFRSECKPLENCKKNKAPLCVECHQEIHHGKQGHIINKTLKLGFQNYLEFIFSKEYFTKEEIKEALNISDNATNSLCKYIKQKNCLYARESVIRACMGGKLLI